MAFWRPRFVRFAEWFATSEPGRRDAINKHLSEISGALELQASFAPFRLTARADRIDLDQDGSARIYDYKTGTIPSPKDVQDLMRPQLPLEAAILRGGGFPDLHADNIASLSYIEIKGGEPAGAQHDRNKRPANELAAEALHGVRRLVEQYDDAGVGYPALRRPKFENHYRYDDYEHLARMQEWAVEDGGGGSGA